MAADHSLPPGIEVTAATAAQEPVIANLLELYAYDFSEFTDLQLGPDGRFGYPDLPTFWTDEGRFPFLVKVDGHLAGFVLSWKGSRISGDRDVWDVAEFFIARHFRKRGVGAAVAHEVWRRFPGRWEVRVMERNQAALAFWSATVDAWGGTKAKRVILERNEKQWHVFSFVSPPGDDR